MFWAGATLVPVSTYKQTQEQTNKPYLVCNPGIACSYIFSNSFLSLLIV